MFAVRLPFPSSIPIWYGGFPTITSNFMAASSFVGYVPWMNE